MTLIAPHPPARGPPGWDAGPELRLQKFRTGARKKILPIPRFSGKTENLHVIALRCRCPNAKTRRRRERSALGSLVVEQPKRRAARSAARQRQRRRGWRRRRSVLTARREGGAACVPRHAPSWRRPLPRRRSGRCSGGAEVADAKEHEEHSPRSHSKCGPESVVGVCCMCASRQCDSAAVGVARDRRTCERPVGLRKTRGGMRGPPVGGL